VRLQDLNGFILSSIALFAIAIGGIIKGNRWLSEPGMPVNEHGWIIYLAASVVMLINGIISIRVARRAERERAAQSAAKPADQSQQSGT
jgi:cytochrome c-type biogenesis protein CcmH/NrfF